MIQIKTMTDGTESEWFTPSKEWLEAAIKVNYPEPERIQFTRIKNDSNGNPRYVMHFLGLLTEEELNGTSIYKYEMALNRARKIGGRKFHNKQYGGGIVFQSYNLREEVRDINAALGFAKYAGYVIE